MLIAVTILSTLIGLISVLSVLLRQSKPAASISNYPKVSILKPLRGMEPDLYENLRSFFTLGPKVPFELLISVKDPKDPAVKLVEQLIYTYPNVAARLFVGTPDLGRNPKVSNMHYAYNRAESDLILISDSNVRVPSDYLEMLVNQRQSENVNLVTQAVFGCDGRTLGGHLDVVSLNTFYLKGTAFIRLFGHENVLGKCMFFSRREFESIGGMMAVKDYLAEDLISGEMMKDGGFSTKVAPVLLRQSTVISNFKGFWNRHVRWARLRKCHFPLAYIIEPLLFETLWPILTMTVSNSPYAFIVGGVCLTVQLTSNLILHQSLTESNALLSFRYFLLKDISMPAVWLAGLVSNRVNWRGQTLLLKWGGQLKAKKYHGYDWGLRGSRPY